MSAGERLCFGEYFCPTQKHRLSGSGELLHILPNVKIKIKNHMTGGPGICDIWSRWSKGLSEVNSLMWIRKGIGPTSSSLGSYEVAI